MTPHQIIQEAFFAKDIKEATKLLETFAFEDIVTIIKKTNARYIANLLAHLHPTTAKEILRVLPQQLVVNAIPHVTAAVAATLLRLLSQKEQEKILQTISSSKAETITPLLEYPTHSAATIMDPTTLTLFEDFTVEEALAQVREHPNSKSSYPVIISRDHKFIGIVSFEDLITAEGGTPVSTICFREVPTIDPLEDQEHAVQLYQEHRFSILPVVDSEARFLGVIGCQILSQSWEETLTAPLQTLVGIPKNEPDQISMWSTIQKRLPWVALNFLIASLAALILFFYKPTLALNPSIVLLLPLLLIIPVSIGAQAHGLTVRGLYLGSYQASAWYQFSLRELFIALVSGGLCALIASTMAYMWSQSIDVALAIGLALWIATIIAGLVGAWGPLIIMAKNNQRSLQASSLTLTALTTLVGLSSYLALINLFLELSK